jgi:hypothetical protein
VSIIMWLWMINSSSNLNLISNPNLSLGFLFFVFCFLVFAGATKLLLVSKVVRLHMKNPSSSLGSKFKLGFNYGPKFKLRFFIFYFWFFVVFFLIGVNKLFSTWRITHCAWGTWAQTWVKFWTRIWFQSFSVFFLLQILSSYFWC